MCYRDTFLPITAIEIMQAVRQVREYLLSTLQYADYVYASALIILMDLLRQFLYPVFYQSARYHHTAQKITVMHRHTQLVHRISFSSVWDDYRT